MAPKPKASELDKNKDGKISAEEAAGGSTDEFGDLFGDLPAPGTGGKGNPLWPYADSSGEATANLTVQDQGVSSMFGSGGRVGARYYEADTLAPLRWSPEERAKVQLALQKIGLYGKKKVRLGSWSADDQDVFASLLASANVEGREWYMQLASWTNNPPADLIDKANGAAEKQPTLRVSNPLDIQESAAKVQQNLTGGGDASFNTGAVSGYQASELAYQKNTMADQEAGGGGVVAQPPSMEAYLADKMRREHPIEVGGYAMLRGFDVLRNMIGGS
jgi:hypothetical protein